MNTYCVTEGCKVECPRPYCRVAWRMNAKFKRTYSSVEWRMSGKFKRTYCRVAWHMTAKFKRTYSSVAWRMNGKITWTLIHAPAGSHRVACPSSASSHERSYMPHPTPPHPPNVHKTPRPSKGRGPTNLTGYYPISTDLYWLVVWNIFYFSIYWECHHPNWRAYFSEG